MLINRRSLLLAVPAAVVAAHLPASCPPADAAALVPPMPSWAVGTPDGWDWLPIKAETAREARLQWVCEQIGHDDCESGEPPDCDCERCEKFRASEVRRVEEWDGAEIGVGSPQWFDAGLWGHCSRCGYEMGTNDNGEIVGAEPVCHECMSVDDWEAVDPERAEELREQKARVAGLAALEG